MSYNRGFVPFDKSKKTKKDAIAVTAVAFQDHLVRSMGGLSLSDPLASHTKPAKPKKVTKPAKATVDTNLRKPAAKKPSPEKEYVLDPKPPPPTLAQKLGLVDAPEPLLSESEWSSVKNKSNARDDSKQPCVICKEDWGSDQQVLLSCSHVFHRNCLQAFERFSGKKSCPMCRREQYQTRVIHEGAHAHRHKCATMIQAWWKGYVVRCWYKKLRKTLPPIDPVLRKKFYEQKFSEITDRLVKSVDHDVNVFLTDIDRSLEQSREVFRHMEAVFRIIPEDEWDTIQLKAVQRGEKDCPICLNDLERRSGPAGQGDAHSAKSHKPSSQNSNNHSHSHEDEGQGHDPWKNKALLSCSHVFHMNCLLTFEELAEGDRRFTCPVCRAKYQKKAIY